MERVLVESVANSGNIDIVFGSGCGGGIYCNGCYSSKCGSTGDSSSGVGGIGAGGSGVGDNRLERWVWRRWL